MNEEGNGGYWYLLTGLVLGLIIGIGVALIFFPVKFIDTAPYSLGPDNKDILRGMIALAYQADGDLGRARIRLDLLRDTEQVSELQAQAQRLLAQGESSQEAQALARMANDLVNATPLPPLTRPASKGVTSASVTANTTPAGTPSVSAQPKKSNTLTPPTGANHTPTGVDTMEAVFTPTLAPANTHIPQITFTQHASLTPLAALSAAFELDKKEPVCDPTQVNPMLQVEVWDNTSKPIPGAQINVVWAGGEDNFFTGLHPEADNGYADFEMKTNVKYSLRVGESGQTISDLIAVKCTSKMGTDYWGGWSLRFVQP